MFYIVNKKAYLAEGEGFVPINVNITDRTVSYSPAGKAVKSLPEKAQPLSIEEVVAKRPEPWARAKKAPAKKASK